MIGYWYLLGLLYRHLSPRTTVTSPYAVIRVDPSTITNREKALYVDEPIDKWANMGEVRGGDWDKSVKPLISSRKYRGVINHFENDIPWEETNIYQESISRIQNGETHWNGCQTLKDVEQRTQEIEALYQTIRNEGFKSQEELHGKSIRRLLLNPLFDRSMTDPTVCIDRDGGLLFGDGYHRLAIATVLNLDEIAVRVVVRHAEWQEIRKGVKQVESVDELSERSRRHLDHPDIREIIPDELQPVESVATKDEPSHDRGDSATSINK